MTPYQFARWCRSEGYSEDIYEEQPYPHPYVTLWLENRRRAALVGYMEYPEPDKGYLGQDADLMLAFEVLDECQEQRAKEEEARAAMAEKVAAMWGSVSSSSSSSSPQQTHRPPRSPSHRLY